jgi:hypothetical protein
VSWYCKIFGEKTTSSPAYRLDSFRAIRFLYEALMRLGVAHDKATIDKMKSFLVDTTFVTAPLNGKKYLLVSHYNKGKQKKHNSV